MPDDSLLLDLRPDHEPGDVLQEHQRDLERVAEVHETGRLVGGVHVQDSPGLHRVVRHDPDRPSVDARETRHDVSRPARLDLEELAAVDDRGNDLVHVVCLPRVVRNDVQQRFLPAVRGIRRGAPGRLLARPGRKVRKVVADGGQAFSVVRDLQIRHAAHLGVDLRSAQRFLGHVFSDDALDEVGSADGERGRPPDHGDEIRESRNVGGARSARTDHRRHQRNDSAHHHLFAKEIARIGEGSDPGRLLRIGGKARARGIDEPDHRNALA